MSRVRLRCARRRGVSLVLVLGLVAIALALSYALLRTQMTAVQVQRNAGRQLEARQAALAGLSDAMRKMHEPNWQGVDTFLQGGLSANAWFEAEFVTGDAALTEASAEYAEYPFRVTITSTGYAADPDRPDARASHKVSAVVQLVRRSLSAEPSNWAALRQHTIYQWANVKTYVQVPVRTEGPVHLQGPLQLCSDAPSNNAARSRYLADLEKMRVAGLGDYRPFQGPLSMPLGRNTVETLNLLREDLKVTVEDVPATSTAPLTLPSGVVSYRLYPGGKAYTVSTIQSRFGSTLSNCTLAPDAKLNPLGVYPSDGSLSLNGNVTIEGTLVGTSTSDFNVCGQNVVIRGRNLPGLYGSASQVQLPALLAGRDFCVRSNAGGSLLGLALVGDDFEFQEGSAATAFSLQGGLQTGSLRLMARDGWKQDDVVWLLWLGLFVSQELKPDGIAHFPRWLLSWAQLDYKPLLTIRPDSSGVAYHWQDFSQPVYAAHPDDGGLRWDLVRWKAEP